MGGMEVQEPKDQEEVWIQEGVGSRKPEKLDQDLLRSTVGLPQWIPGNNEVMETTPIDQGCPSLSLRADIKLSKDNIHSLLSEDSADNQLSERTRLPTPFMQEKPI